MAPPRFVPRHRRKLKIALGSRQPSFTSDVSAGGFSVETTLVHRPGTRIDGEITVQGKEFSFRGEVSWAQPGDPCLSLRGRMGVRFVDIDSEFFEALRTAL